MSYALELFIQKEELKAIRKVIKIANESYVLNYKEEPDSPTSVKFTISCPKSNAAQAFWHFGILDAQHRLSKRKK